VFEGKVCWHGLVRTWWESALIGFGMKLKFGAWYGGMAGTSLVGAWLCWYGLV
jgi:hypothetical protein